MITYTQRLNVLNRLSVDLREMAQGGKNIDNAYIWFNYKCREYALTEREQFRVVLMAGTMKLNLTEEPKTYLWEEKPQGKAKAPSRTFVKPAPVAPQRATAPAEPEKRVNVSSKCMRDARKALGAFPYNEPGNILVGDGYFSRDCINKYGQKQWDEACRLVEADMKRWKR